MNSDKYKKEKWNKASTLQKMRYWVIMHNNQEILLRQNCNRVDQDDSSNFRNYEELKSYRSDMPSSESNLNIFKPEEKFSDRDNNYQEDDSNIDLDGESSELDFKNYSTMIDHNEEPKDLTNTQKILLNTLDMKSMYLFWLKYFNISQRTALFQRLYNEPNL